MEQVKTFDDAWKELQRKIKSELTSQGLKPREVKERAEEIETKVVHTLTRNYRDINSPEIDELDYLGSYLTLCNLVVTYHSLGDTLGYKNGEWEFNYGDPKAGPEFVTEMLFEFLELGGINQIDLRGWRASDDTILYHATLRALTETYGQDVNAFGEACRRAYLDSVDDMASRHPGDITKGSLREQKRINWDQLEYDGDARGSGSAMRAGCIGIFYPGEVDRDELIARAVESSRITHNSATAILGSVTAALFTALALERVEVEEWPHRLIALIRSKAIDRYLESSRPAEYSYYRRDHHLFLNAWETYLRLLPPGVVPRRMKNPVERYRYLTENFSRGCLTPGGCADDATIMAYDAVKRAQGNLEKLILYAVLHPGDSDTVGCIAFGWHCAYYLDSVELGVSLPMIEKLEFRDWIVQQGLAETVGNQWIQTLVGKIGWSLAKKLIEE